MSNFNLIEYQQQARDITTSASLYTFWDGICKRYEREEINDYELEEMRAVIFPRFQVLAEVERIANL